MSLLQEKTEILHRNFTYLKEIDILKGIGIILVVFAHAGCPEYQFFYLFHMAIFFIATGFCFKPERLENFKSLLLLIKKRIISLYIPFVLGNILLWFYDQFLIINCKMENSFSFFNIVKQIIRSVLLLGTPYSAGALWFLRDLFLISCAYAILYYIIGMLLKIKHVLFIILVFGIFLLYTGWFFLQKSLIPIFIFHECATFFFLPLGTLLAHHRDYINTKINKYFLLLFVSTLMVLLVLYMKVFYFRLRIDLAVGLMKSPTLYIIASLCGWFMVYSISIFISRVKIGDFIAYVGKNSLSVFILHFAAFRLFSLLYIRLNSLSLAKIEKFPVINNSLWLFYSICGIVIPLLLAVTYRYCSNKIQTKLEKQ